MAQAPTTEDEQGAVVATSGHSGPCSPWHAHATAVWALGLPAPYGPSAQPQHTSMRAGRRQKPRSPRSQRMPAGARSGGGSRRWDKAGAAPGHARGLDIAAAAKQLLQMILQMLQEGLGQRHRCPSAPAGRGFSRGAPTMGAAQWPGGCRAAATGLKSLHKPYGARRTAAESCGSGGAPAVKAGRWALYRGSIALL